MSYKGVYDFHHLVAQGLVGTEYFIRDFGSDSDIPNGTEELISSLSAAGFGVFLSAAATVRIKAGGNVGDTAAGAGARSVTIEGVDASGNRQVESVATAGASASANFAGTWLRVDKAYISDSGVGSYTAPWNLGDIVIETTGSVDLVRINALRGEAQHAAYTVPSGFTAYLTSIELTVDSTKAATFRLYSRENILDVTTPFQPRRLKGTWAGLNGALEVPIDEPSFLCTGPADVYMTATGDGGTASVSATFSLHIVPTPT